MQRDFTADGQYVLETQPGKTPQKLSFFRSWRWRDRQSVVYIPFTPGQPMSLAAYDVVSGKSQQFTDPATQPFVIAKDDWSISPDGQMIVFWAVKDFAIWSVTLHS